MSADWMGYLLWAGISLAGYLLYQGSMMAKRDERDHWDDE